MKIKELYKKNKHCLMLIYFLIYLPIFAFLNEFTPTRQNILWMHSGIDDLIPFCTFFVIPYFLWFAYIAVCYVFFFFADKEEFVRMCIFLYAGMTISLIMYFILPNGQQLRIDYDAAGQSGFLIECIKLLQKTDTPYNVFPSIHCINSFGVHIALMKSKKLGRYKIPVVTASFMLMILIVLSTVFVKQHSVLDVFGAIVLILPLYLLSYKTKITIKD